MLGRIQGTARPRRGRLSRTNCLSRLSYESLRGDGAAVRALSRRAGWPSWRRPSAWRGCGCSNAWPPGASREALYRGCIWTNSAESAGLRPGRVRSRSPSRPDWAKRIFASQDDGLAVDMHEFAGLAWFANPCAQRKTMCARKTIFVRRISGQRTSSTRRAFRCGAVRARASADDHSRTILPRKGCYCTAIYVALH